VVIGPCPDRRVCRRVAQCGHQAVETGRVHVEQHVTGRALGWYTGHGLRDHSWGPRYWQAPWYYRWLTANVDQDFGFMASRVAKKDGPGTRGGFVWERGQMHYCDDVSISTETRGDDAYHQRITGLLRSSRSGKEWAFTGEVMDLIPLRNRRQDPDGNWLMTRISEGMTKWTIESGEYAGKVGYGLSEYLDQIIDGSPVGLAE
jgi:hypothetical protein